MVEICFERRCSYSVTNASSEDLRLSYAWSHNDEGLIGDVEAAAAAVGTDGCAAAWVMILELLGDNDVFEDVGTTVVAIVGTVCDGSDDALWRTTKAELSCPTRLLLLVLLVLLLLPKMIFRRRLTGIATSSYVLN